jgi:hypothetical protein
MFKFILVLYKPWCVRVRARAFVRVSEWVNVRMREICNCNYLSIFVTLSSILHISLSVMEHTFCMTLSRMSNVRVSWLILAYVLLVCYLHTVIWILLKIKILMRVEIMMVWNAVYDRQNFSSSAFSLSGDWYSLRRIRNFFHCSVLITNFIFQSFLPNFSKYIYLKKNIFNYLHI